MCGIVGFLDKRGGQECPIGRTLLSMLKALSCRGPDSAGLAVFQQPPAWRARVSVRPGVSAEEAVTALTRAGLSVFGDYRNGVYDAILEDAEAIGSVEDAVQSELPG